MIIRNTLLPLSFKRDGYYESLQYWKEFEKSQYWSIEKLKEYQWDKLQTILEYAYNNVPYYKRVFDERNLNPASFTQFSDLEKLPILTRDLIRKYKDELISTQFQKSDLIEFGTGGTTRRNMYLYRDMHSHNIKAGAAYRFEGFMGRKPAGKLCLFWPVHIDYDPNIALRTKIKNRFITREILFFAGAPSEETLHDFYLQAKSFKPRYIKAFPNALCRFTEYLHANNLRLPSVKAILSTGETLMPYHRQKFNDVFDVPVFNMYGSREVGNTASECSYHHGLHITMETSLVEITQNGKQLQTGEEGEILITDLTNFGFPMIRYAVEDFGKKLPGKCKCGRELELMSPGVGRLLDRYVAPDGTKHSALAISAYIAEEGPKLGQIQYRQKSLMEYHLKITNDPPVNDEIKNHIRNIMYKLISPKINITFETIDELPREVSGKIRYFICDVDADDIHDNWD